MGKQKVALVLSMGGARGIAHIGVIEELLRHNYEITSIAGSSMGAMVGAMYASGKLEECKEWLYSWDKRKMWELADLTLSRDGLVKGDRFIKELKQIIPVMNIEELPIPYVAMATDIVCDQEVRFDSGNLYDAIRATISIPMLFRPLRKDGMVLIDGGILNPLPLNQVHRTEEDILIHNAHEPNPGVHMMLVNMRYPNYPVALGVIRDVPDHTYDDNIVDQLEEIRAKSNIHCVDDLLRSGETWEIR